MSRPTKFFFINKRKSKQNFSQAILIKIVQRRILIDSIHIIT